jgi:Spy/CpxP family protein refolding chaperone
MKESAIKGTFILLISLLFISGLNAQHHRRVQGPYGQGPHREVFRLSVVERLDLTAAQQETLKSLRTEHYKTMRPLRNKMTELRARERTLMSEEKIDKNEVSKTIDEQTELTSQIRKLQLDHRLAVREILTEDQLMQLDRQRDQRQRFDRQGNEHWGSPRKGRPYHRNWG